MSIALQLFTTALVSSLASTAVLRALSRPLASVLGRICPDESAAAFWLRYAQVMLTLAPLLVAMTVDMLGGTRPPIEAFRLTLLASLVGLLIGLAAIGRRLGRFIAAPREGNLV